MNKLKKRSLLFCIETLMGGGAEKLLIDILKRIDYESFDVDLCVLYSKGVYFDNIPDSVKCFIYEESNAFPAKNYDIEIAFLEGTTTRKIALHENRHLSNDSSRQSRFTFLTHLNVPPDNN